MPTGQLFRSDSDLLAFLHDRAGWSHKCSAERVGVALFAGVFSNAFFQHLRLPPRRNQMTELMGRRLSAAIAPMIPVEKDASAESIVVCEHAGNSAIDATNIDAHTKLELQ